MAISETDLKLLKSERLTDFDDGGGKMTGVEVVDGEVNNLFNDISPLDQIIGRVSLRKAYVAVQTATVDTYLGAHVIVTDPPNDDNVQVTLFSTGSWTDERVQAQDRIESYSIIGPKSNWILYGNHINGQKLVRLFSLSNADSLTVPASEASFEIGDVIVLKQDAEGYPAVQQYLRVTQIMSRETKKYTDANGDFYKDELIIEVSNALLDDYAGAEISRYSSVVSPTAVHTSSVADAQRYYGVKKLVQAVTLGDTVLDIGSPYTNLVPSATAETPLVDVSAGSTHANYKQAGAAGTLTASATLTGTVAPDYAANLYLGRGFTPGSLALTIGGVAYKDNGSGSIVLATGTGGSYGGTADYASGHLVITKASSWTAAVSAAATQAVAIVDNGATFSIPVTVNNRALSWVKTLSPVPAPGTLSVAFKALDKWVSLSDDGNGHLVGTAGAGTGTVDYATGSALVTLGALPDVDSAIIYSWSTPADYTQQSEVLTPPPPQIAATLSFVPVAPASLTISWTNGGSKTATAAADGSISGDATGTLVHENGDLVFSPNSIPAAGTVFNLAYHQATGETDVFTVTGDSGGVVSLTLTQTPVKPGSVNLSYQVQVPASEGYLNGTGAVLPPNQTINRTITDNGSGGLLDETGTAIAGATINYSTGAVTFDSTTNVVVDKFVGTTLDVGWVLLGFSGLAFEKPVFVSQTVQQILVASTTLTAHYVKNSASTVAKTGSITLAALQVDLTTVTAADIVANSLRFTFAGTVYLDRSGTLYRAHSVTTDSATAAGSVDYQSGIATLTNWVAGSNTLTLQGMVTVAGQAGVPAVFFRTPGAPLSTGQFQISAVTTNGEDITASADNNGDIASEWITGHVDWQSGVASAAFGKKLLDSTLPASIKAGNWYDAANIDGSGMIWVPLLVKPETITFNAVLVSYIPLDADILGVDTVRLPQDGRVPIFRIGDVAVVHNTQTLTLPNPAVAGTTHDCGRTLLSYAKVFDAAGQIVPTDRFTTNLDAGTVTLATPLDLTGYTQPLTIEHRIEDAALVGDVQITGQISLLKPVRHAYAAESSYLSSALLIGDMQARVTNLFDQETWSGEFSDTLIGDASTSSFNDVLYPIVVTNAGAIQERWAIVFTGSTAFDVYGEYSGLIAQGTTGTDLATINPISGTPYFTINHIGWGTGWSAGNVLRFNTVAANYPLWLARTTLQSDPTESSDNFKLQLKGASN